MGMQQTWDHSSLKSPFFFVSGSLILVTGNFLALLAILGLLAGTLINFEYWIRSNLLNQIYGGEPTTVLYTVLNAILFLCGAAIFFSGMQAVYSRLRGGVEHVGRLSKLSSNTVGRYGLFGGFVGGVLGAFAVTYFYYVAWINQYNTLLNAGEYYNYDTPTNFGIPLVEITVAGTFVTILLGYFSLIFGNLVYDKNIDRLSRSQSYICGAIMGGILTGVIAGPFVTNFFGQMSRPVMSPIILIPGALIAVALVIFAIVNYDLEKMSLKRFVINTKGLFYSLFGGTMIAVVIFVPLQLFGITPFVIGWMEEAKDAPHLLFGGLVYGIPLGFVLGATIGLARSYSADARW